MPMSACLQKKLWSSCCCCPPLPARASLRDSRSAHMPSSMRRTLRFWGPSQAGERLPRPGLAFLPQLGRSSELATMLLPSSELLPMLGVRASTLGEPSAQASVVRGLLQITQRASLILMQGLWASQACSKQADQRRLKLSTPCIALQNCLTDTCSRETQAAHHGGQALRPASSHSPG